MNLSSHYVTPIFKVLIKERNIELYTFVQMIQMLCSLRLKHGNSVFHTELLQFNVSFFSFFVLQQRRRIEDFKDMGIRANVSLLC